MVGINLSTTIKSERLVTALSKAGYTLRFIKHQKQEKWVGVWSDEIKIRDNKRNTVIFKHKKEVDKSTY